MNEIKAIYNLYNIYVKSVIPDMWSQTGQMHMLKIMHALEKCKIITLPQTLICKMCNTIYSELHLRLI